MDMHFYIIYLNINFTYVLLKVPETTVLSNFIILLGIRAKIIQVFRIYIPTGRRIKWLSDFYCANK